MKFKKMHGCGNDFVVLDARESDVTIDAKRAAFIADRRLGVGCDQIVLLKKSAAADVRMEIFNADGSHVSTCGNASRCVGDILADELGKDDVTIETDVGVLNATRIATREVAVAMGKPKLEWAEIPLSESRNTLHLGLAEGALTDPVAVSMGNPHAIFFVKSLNVIDMARDGKPLETNPLFPERANISAVQVLAPDHLRMKVWERGSGETLACGSAACAALVAGVRRGVCGREATIDLPGGSLHIQWQPEEEGGQVIMRGEVSYVFAGTLCA